MKSDLIQELDILLGKEHAFDIKTRTLEVQSMPVYLYYCNFLIDSAKMAEIIKSVIRLAEIPTHEAILKQLTSHLVNESIDVTENMDDIVTAVLSGELAIIIPHESKMIRAEIRRYPGREIGEPDSEKVVRGSRDGFTESIATNIALVRRRIKTGKLCIKSYLIGDMSKTQVALVYLEGQVDPKVIHHVQSRFEKVHPQELTMSDKALEELLIENTYTPYPLVRYTERPDTFAAHLYQGMFGILVDTSPSAIIGPVSIFDHMQHAEEYRQTMIAGSYLRILRFIGIIATFLIIPLWFALLPHSSIIPSFLQGFFDISDTRSHIFFQLILIEVGIELVRMASIHTPSALATSMGLIAGIIIGEMAVNVGLFSEIIVLLGATSAIGSYITPSYELSLANKIIKLILIIIIYFLELPGLIIGLVALFIYLVKLKSFSRSYLYPLIPFNGKQMLKQMFRLPYKYKNEKR